MEGLSVSAILKIVAEYGILGVGWVAWLFTMFYIQAERKRYQSLVLHIIDYFIKTQARNQPPELPDPKDDNPFTKLFGKE